MSAADEAREVEMVARAVVFDRHLWGGGYYCSCGHELNSPQGFSRHLLEELEPVLTAERQEAAREAWDDGYAAGWDDADGGVGLFDDPNAAANPYRADGVAGRSET